MIQSYTLAKWYNLLASAVASVAAFYCACYEMKSSVCHGADKEIKQGFFGKVTELTGESLTLQSLDMGVGGATETTFDGKVTVHTGKKVTVGKIVDQMIHDMATGTKVVHARDSITVFDGRGVVATYHRSEMPPKKFRVAAGLRNGMLPDDARGAYSYRFTDVRIGDEIDIDARKVDGRWEVLRIKIERRPGGAVPLEGRPADSKNPWRDTAQAYQDFEEKGTPLPERLRPKNPQKP